MIRNSWILTNSVNAGFAVMAIPFYSGLEFFIKGDEFVKSQKNNSFTSNIKAADDSVWIYNPDITKTSINRYFRDMLRLGVSKFGASPCHVNNNCGLVKVSTKFKLKITDCFDLVVKCPLFPDPNKWYNIINLSRRELKYLIPSMLKNVPFDATTLEFKEEFDVAILDTKDSSVGKNSDLFEIIFVNPKMPEYTICKDNCVRHLLNKLKKRVTKLTPGHMYSDDSGNAYYCLAEVRSRLDSYDGFISNTAKENNIVWIVSNKIPDGTITSIKDILITKVLGSSNDDNRISIFYKNGSSRRSFYDLGTFTTAVNDLPPNIQLLFPKLWDNIKNEVYSDLNLDKSKKDVEIASRALDLINIQSPGYDSFRDIPNTMKAEVLNCFNEILRKATLQISTAASKIDLSIVLRSFHKILSNYGVFGILSNIPYNKVITSYTDIFSNILNVTLDQQYINKNIGNVFLDVLKDFDLYTSYIDYLTECDLVRKLYFSRLSLDEVKLYYGKNTSLHDYTRLGFAFKNVFLRGEDNAPIKDTVLSKLTWDSRYKPDLTDAEKNAMRLDYETFSDVLDKIVIKELRSYIKNNCTNTGTVSTMTVINNVPVVYVKISLKDVIDYYVKTGGLTDNIKNLILNLKFSQLIGWVSLVDSLEKDIFYDSFSFNKK